MDNYFGENYEQFIISMKENIIDFGAERVWTIIESIKCADVRLAYRGIFFKAGGKI